jgi:acetoacetyl-CoA synthetase
VLEDKPMDQIPSWFLGAKLNFAENLLWCRDKNKVALISTGIMNEFILIILKILSI